MYLYVLNEMHIAEEILNMFQCCPLFVKCQELDTTGKYFLRISTVIILFILYTCLVNQKTNCYIICYKIVLTISMHNMFNSWSVRGDWVNC